jgi:hypothetical protein
MISRFNKINRKRDNILGKENNEQGIAGKSGNNYKRTQRSSDSTPQGNKETKNN